jgi:hypothetical protein
MKAAVTNAVQSNRFSNESRFINDCQVFKALQAICEFLENNEVPICFLVNVVIQVFPDSP